MRKLYLAYGSNLSIEQMGVRCPGATIVGTAEIKDYRLQYKGSQTGAYATIEEEIGQKVPVLVWEITKYDEKSLDRYEGYNEKGYCFYTKEYLDVDIKGLDGEDLGRHQAMVYIMDRKRVHGIPSEYYTDIIKQGYERFGFDMTILDEAMDYTLAQKVYGIK